MLGLHFERTMNRVVVLVAIVACASTVCMSKTVPRVLVTVELINEEHRLDDCAGCTFDVSIAGAQATERSLVEALEVLFSMDWFRWGMGWKGCTTDRGSAEMALSIDICPLALQLEKSAYGVLVEVARGSWENTHKTGCKRPEYWREDCIRADPLSVSSGWLRKVRYEVVDWEGPIYFTDADSLRSTHERDPGRRAILPIDLSNPDGIVGAFTIRLQSYDWRGDLAEYRVTLRLAPSE